MKIDVMVAGQEHLRFVTQINDAIDEAAKQRGTGIARRTDEYIADKINSGKAIIAVNRNEFVGFCYIESWGHDEFVANSGLIVRPQYRGMGVAKRIKQAAFELSRKRFPNAKLFGLTTGEAVMRINTELGYEPVTLAVRVPGVVVEVGGAGFLGHVRKDGLHLGVGSRITVFFPAVAALTNDLSIPHDHASNRHFSFVESFLGFTKGGLHKKLLLIHGASCAASAVASDGVSESEDSSGGFSGSFLL